MDKCHYILPLQPMDCLRMGRPECNSLLRSRGHTSREYSAMYVNLQTVLMSYCRGIYRTILLCAWR